MERWFCAIALFAVSTSANAFLFGSNPEIKVQIPNTIDDGNLVPVLVQALDFDDDKVVAIELAVPSNPDGYRQPISMRYVKPRKDGYLSTRVRLGGQPGTATIMATAVLASGQRKAGTASAQLNKPVDFSNPESLNSIFQGGLKFPTAQIGQVAFIRKPVNGKPFSLISTSIYHPMVPGIADVPGRYVNQIKFKSGGNDFATAETSPALSNNLFLQFIVDNEMDKLTAEWLDTGNHTYRGEEGMHP